MSHLCAAARLLALLVVSLYLMPLAFLVSLGGGLAGRRGRATVLRIQPHFTRVWSRINLAIMGVKLINSDPRPQRAGLITSNHLSYLDIMVLAAFFPSRFIAKREIAGWPFVGLLTRAVGTIFLERKRSREVVRLGPELRETLAAGISVVFFPEGAISDGQTVRPFHGGLLETAVQEGIACLPVCLHYEVADPRVTPATEVCWANECPLIVHFWRVLRMRRIEARVRWAASPLVDTDRKRLAERLHAATLEMFEPVRN